MTINKEIARLHFITIDHPAVSHADQAIRAYKAGCKWVQLRMKDRSPDEIEKEVRKILKIPEHMAVSFAVRLGYPAVQQGYVRVRRDIESFTYRNAFGKKW